MKSFTITTVKTYTPIWIRSEFSSYGEGWKRVRANLSYKADRCFWCDRMFDDGESIALIALLKVGNKVFCENCANKLK